MFNSTFDRSDKKIGILKEEDQKRKKDFTHLKKCGQYHSENISELNKKLEIFDRRVEEIKLDQRNWDFVEKKPADLEHRSGQNNLFWGDFQQKTNETWKESESAMTDFKDVKEKVRIVEYISFERAYCKCKGKEIHKNDAKENFSEDTVGILKGLLQKAKDVRL